MRNLGLFLAWSAISFVLCVASIYTLTRLVAPPAILLEIAQVSVGLFLAGGSLFSWSLGLGYGLDFLEHDAGWL